MNAKTFKERLLENVRLRLSKEQNTDDKAAMEIIISEAFNDNDSESLSNEELDSIIQKVFLITRKRLGILDPLLQDNDVTEIMVNGPDKVFVERKGKIEKYSFSFDSVHELEEVIRNIASDVHREINEMNPIVDARLKDGSRVNAVFKNIAFGGPSLTIRKFSEDHMTLNDLIENDTLDKRTAEFLKILTESGYNIFVSGGTSSGKTTLLNAISECIPSQERVIVIEDSLELKLAKIENIVRLECRNANSGGLGRITMSDLIRSSLRMRPNRIIVGEVRGPEVLDMLNAMNTGHSGSMSTGHGNSVKGMLRRLESMYMMAVPLDIMAIRSQIAEGIDIMIHLEKLENGQRKIVDISEITGLDNGDFSINTIAKLESGHLKTIGRLADVTKLRLHSREDDYDRLQFMDNGQKPKDQGLFHNTALIVYNR